MTRFISASLLLALALGATPGSAAVSATHTVYRYHQGEVHQHSGAPIEVSMGAYTGSAVADGEVSDLPSEICVSLFAPSEAGGTAEEACGEVAIEVVPGLTAMRIVGSLEGSAYGYVNDPEHGPTFTDLGPSEFSIDLLLTGSGDHRASEPTLAPGVCGLPPDTRGVGVFVDVPLARDAVVSGRLEATNIGAVDPSSLSGVLTDFVFATAHACVD